MSSGAMVERDKFAALRPGARLWAVASIHGEVERLRHLHETLAPVLGADDRLVYLGNYLGRGPDVAGTIDELLQFRRWFLARRRAMVCDLAYLRGAQEEIWHKLLQLQFATDPRGVLDWMLENGLGSTLSAYGADSDQGRGAARDGALAIGRWTSRLRDAVRARAGHDPFFSGLRRAAIAGRILLAHAGIDPSRPLNAQSDSFWWGSPGFATLDQPYGEFAMVVRGFDRQRPGVVSTGYTTTIDGGCGFDGPLIACAFDSDGIVVDRVEA
jgi:serine/threonine protein phosphatase 1